MASKSPVLHLYLESFKAAAGEGATSELKMRLLAGKIPALQKYTHQRQLGEIETDLQTHFATSLSEPEKETFRLSRQLRNKVLHSDFRAAREKLQELGVQIESGRVAKIDLPTPTVAEVTRKLLAAKEGKEGTPVSNTLSIGPKPLAEGQTVNKNKYNLTNEHYSNNRKTSRNF